MHKSALELFLAESTALAVIGEFDALGSMASALNKRHKLRHTDLNQMLTLAAAQPPDTYERDILVFNIMVLGGGAYADCSGLLSIKDLMSAKVSPHWDPQTLHNFHTVCVWEPMNLWAGWANENQSNNNTMLDLHILKQFQNTGLIYTDMGAQTSKVTQNMNLAQKLLPGATAKTNLQLTQPSPPLQRRYSAHSGMLCNFEGQIKNTIDQVNHYSDPAKYSEVMRQNLIAMLKEVSEMEVRSTSAGEQHYDELLHSLHERGLSTLDVYTKINNARQHWNFYRNNLRKEIYKCQKKLLSHNFISSAFTKP